jgi:hypothetical protein
MFPGEMKKRDARTSTHRADQGQRNPSDSNSDESAQNRTADGRGGQQDKRSSRFSDPLPRVTLPRGGGAIRGVGEKFSVNAVSGTAALTVPLTLSPGRSGFTPSLELSYDSGSGNGPFGFGWHLSLPAITRKTDKGLPQYRDVDESDVFVLSGAEDLVPILDADGARVQFSRTVSGIQYQIHTYRPRIERMFSRIERWVAVAAGVTHWRTISKSNVATLYGYDNLSSVADPADPTKTFSWLACRSWDDKGNVAIYNYAAEDDQGVDMAQSNEANRTSVDRAVQR